MESEPYSCFTREMCFDYGYMFKLYSCNHSCLANNHKYYGNIITRVITVFYLWWRRYLDVDRKIELSL
uniref:Uncharacterized protein n=1 Tax=Strigamia maritima TaxID=126957 RepID=T1JPF3_STRMM